MFDEAKLLKQQIASKDNELRQLKAGIARLNKMHEANLQTNIDLYRMKHNKLNDEKAALSKMFTL